MAERWGTLILLLFKLPVPVFAETVNRQREEVPDEKQRRSSGAQKTFLNIIQMDNHFFSNGGRENDGLVKTSNSPVLFRAHRSLEM